MVGRQGEQRYRMNVWVKRLLMGLFVLVWLVLMITPAMAFVLAARGQLQLGPQDGRHVRVFLLEDADAEGVGLERARPVAPPQDAVGASCLQNSVSYWIWSGERDDSQDVSFCQCFGPDGGALPASVVPSACAAP